jgi:hypothetical protein
LVEVRKLININQSLLGFKKVFFIIKVYFNFHFFVRFEPLTEWDIFVIMLIQII